MNTALLFIVFNRPGTTLAVFEAIRNAKPSKLYIAADAPRPSNEHDINACDEVRNIIENIDWPCSVYRLYQDHNLGCSYGPRAALTWFFSHEEMGIILEDDCLPGPDFFIFCEEMLTRFKDNKSILNICGSNMGYMTERRESYLFSRFMNMSGWATWRRSAEAIDYQLSDWQPKENKLLRLYKNLRQHVFDFDIDWYRYWKHKFDRTTTEANISWWDWQWIYYQIFNKKLSVIPSKNLVTNIGFNESATHTKDPNNPLANVPVHSLKYPLVHPEKISPDFKYEEFAVKWVWCYHRRSTMLMYGKRLISKLNRRTKK